MMSFSCFEDAYHFVLDDKKFSISDIKFTENEYGQEVYFIEEEK